MVFSKEGGILIKVLRQSKGYNAWKLLEEFPDKDWSCSALDRLLRQIDATQSADRKSSSSREHTVCTRDMQMSVQMATTFILLQNSWVFFVKISQIKWYFIKCNSWYLLYKLTHHVYSVGWHKCLQSFVVVFHSAVNGFLGMADQTDWSAFLNSATVFGFCASCDKTPALLQTWQSSGLRLDELGPLIISDKVKAIWLVYI